MSKKKKKAKKSKPFIFSTVLYPLKFPPLSVRFYEYEGESNEQTSEEMENKNPEKK